MKILDCTLRDGGYYTNWDFDDALVTTYINAMNQLPIDYIELGYRNVPSNGYTGKFGYSPVSVLKQIRNNSKKKLAIMLNEKSTRPDDLSTLLLPIIGLVDMIRIAVDPINFERAVILATEIKKLGFEVGFNTMYMSKWKEYEGFLDKLEKINGIADLFCMVDSFGGITPSDIKEITKIVKEKTTCPIGFHGHNNLQLGLINTLTAIEEGVDFVDATILGMGRGAGNLNMELLLTMLSKRGLEVKFNILGDVIFSFQPLLDKYAWGTNLPYMLSGANSIPQKDVMDWVTNRTYSFNSIVLALDNRRNGIEDNTHYPLLPNISARRMMIVGGGNSVVTHTSAIIEFLQRNQDIIVILATSRHATLFNKINNKKIYCLVGNEAKRMTCNIKKNEFKGICVLPPYPRTMGTEVPEYAKPHTYELPEIAFTKQYQDSCTAVALKTTIEANTEEIFLVGYDGYMGEILSDKEMDLSNENRTLFENYINFTGKKLQSLTPTLYKSLIAKSVYQYL